MKFFKIVFGKSKSYSHQKIEFGFKVVKFFAKLDHYKHQVNITFNLSYIDYEIFIYWGQATRDKGNNAFESWERGRKVTCHNSEETCHLQKNKEYTVDNLRWENSGNGSLHRRISLMELDPKFYYEASRFVEQPPEIEED
jgi:hypothetical protein